MAANPKSTPQPKTQSAAEQGNAEVAKRMEKELEQGYVGTTFDEYPNSAYSLASGPDAPPLVPDNKSRVEQHSASTKKES